MDSEEIKTGRVKAEAFRDGGEPAFLPVLPQDFPDAGGKGLEGVDLGFVFDVFCVGIHVEKGFKVQGSRFRVQGL